MNPLKSVGMKLFFIFFFSILICVLAVGITSYSIAKQTITDKVQDASLQTIMQANGRLDFLLRSFESIALQLVIDQQIRDNLTSFSLEADDYSKLVATRNITTVFNSFALTNKMVASISLISPDHDIYISTLGVVGPDTTKTDWYQQISKSQSTSWLPTKEKGYISSISGQPTFALGKPMVNMDSGENMGMLLIEFKASALGDELASYSIGESGSAYLVTAQNDIIASSGDDPPETKSPIQLEFKEESYKNTMDVQGQSSLVVYAKSEQSGWFLVSDEPISNLTKETQKIFNVSFWIALLAAVLAILIGFMVMRMIGRPLVRLRNLMKQGEQGKLNVRTNFKSKDEIGQLGKSFNQMMEQITLLVKQTNDSAQEVLSTSGELSSASKKTAVSAREISEATEEIANGAATLAVEAERGNELTGHISTRMHSVVEANKLMGTSADEVRSVSERGAVNMRGVMEKTSLTEKMTRAMVDKVDKLKESTASIRQILDMLNNITKQTNILALNATIEAARAGAAGKGFMVVADEIRKLADQSRQSIDVVGQITETIQQEIDETVNVLSEAYPIFQQQAESVKEADVIFTNVQEQMSDFTRQLKSVTESIEQLEDAQTTLSEAMSSVSAVSQQSSATSEEVASLSSEQLRVSEGLVDLSNKLEGLSGSLKQSLTRFEV